MSCETVHDGTVYMAPRTLYDWLIDPNAAQLHVQWIQPLDQILQRVWTHGTQAEKDVWCLGVEFVDQVAELAHAPPQDQLCSLYQITLLVYVWCLERAREALAPHDYKWLCTQWPERWSAWVMGATPDAADTVLFAFDLAHHYRQYVKPYVPQVVRSTTPPSQSPNPIEHLHPTDRLQSTVHPVGQVGIATAPARALPASVPVRGPATNHRP